MKKGRVFYIALFITIFAAGWFLFGNVFSGAEMADDKKLSKGISYHREKEKMENIMQQNFAHVHTMLNGLIYSKSDIILDAAQLLRKHAYELKQLKPDKNLGNIKIYQFLAEDLIAHTDNIILAAKNNNLELISTELGKMVNECVTCHIKFRDKPIQK
ncbi:MAG: hypothetical protein HZB80_05060 [Deltaproteobacteria bacterium]|nr:hypothetical protein [Deltaproteobacteria bacterium]